MKRLFTFNLSAMLLIMLWVGLTVPMTVRAESYTVNIDDISRVTVRLFDATTFIPYEAEDFHSGINIVELDGTTAGIQFQATEGNEITTVHLVGPGVGFPEPGIDLPARNGLYTIYPGSADWDGSVITVTSRVAIPMTATINIDNSNYISLQDGARSPVDIKSGSNTITFNGSDNPFYVILYNYNTPLTVKKNGEQITEEGALYATFILDDGDVIDIDTNAEAQYNPALWPNPDTIVTDFPEASYPMSFTRSSYFFRSDSEGYVTGAARFIIFSPDINKAFIENPLTFLDTDAYLVGEHNQSLIEIRLPQLIYEDGDTKYWAYRLDATDDGYAIDPDVHQIVYLRNEGTWYLNKEKDEDFIIGYCTADGKWTGYGDKDLIYSDLNENTVTAPRGSVFNTYTQSPDGNNVSIAVNSSNEVYLKGLLPALPDASVTGTIEKGKIRIPSRQYLGVYEGWHIYFYGTENNGDLAEDLIMDYDVDSDTYTAGAGAGYIITPGNLIAEPIVKVSNHTFSNINNGISAIMDMESVRAIFYDITGRKIENPVKGGLYIMTTEAADGSVTSQKVIF